MTNSTDEYLKSLLSPTAEWVQQIEIQAAEESIPIMDQLSMNFLMQIIRIKQPKNILEIGTAIGYSALRMNEAFPNTKITTIERDDLRINQARKNIQMHSKEKEIEILQGDALEVMQKLQTNNEQFDLIFIDAAKGQYKNFFKQGSKLLLKEGVMITDNVLFKHYVINAEYAHKRHRNLAEKIASFNEWLVAHPDFYTTVIPIGDGVALSMKK